MLYEDFKNFLEEKKVYIFGAGTLGRECLALLLRHKISVEAFWDNDATKHGTLIEKIPIEKPHIVKNAVIVIAIWRYYNKVNEQLIKMGFADENVFLKEELDILDIHSQQIQEDNRNINEYPTTIQLPITYKCNFNCVMCGMQNLTGRKEITAIELKKILSDRLFSHVKFVGINGGEPFLRRDLRECLNIIIETLPQLEQIYIISNGFLTQKILDDLLFLKNICTNKKIKINLSISIDGINDMQDFHRGMKDSFVNADKTITNILKDRERYVDNLNVICTITRYNISRINEVVVWAEKKEVEVEYNIATVNRRIDNLDKEKDFSIMQDEHSRMLATEFFYCLYQKTKKEKYFALYLYLQERKRYAKCPCQYSEWITVLPNGQIEFCATHSKSLGSGIEHSAYDLVNGSTDYLNEITNEYCQKCSHYISALNVQGKRRLYEECVKNRIMR